MKKPNPFAPWEEDPSRIIGRKEEERLFKSFVEAIGGGQNPTMIIYGAPGMGKTILIKHLKGEGEKSGLRTFLIKAEKGEDEGGITEKLYNEMIGFAEGSVKGIPQTFHDLIRSVKESREEGVIIFIDDVDRMRDAAAFAKKASREVKATRRKIGIFFSSAKPLRMDNVMEMEILPFDEQEGRELVEKALKDNQVKMGDECLATILSESSGNPRLFRTICWHIYERLKENEKIISKGHYLAYLPAIMSVLAREWFGKLYQKTPEAERAIIEVLARNPEGMHVSDIAAELGKPLGPVTALTGRLLERGLITRLDRGQYRIFSRIYAKYVLQRGSI